MTTTDTAVADDAASDNLRIRPHVRATLVTGTAMQVSVQAGPHAFTIDEPEALGGTNIGANPVEHLLAALGSCPVITYQVWAEKLGIKVDEIEVALRGDLDLRGFFGLDPDVRPGFEGIEFDVRFTGPETDERYEELNQAVQRHCPVLDNVGQPVPVTSTFQRA